MVYLFQVFRDLVPGPSYFYRSRKYCTYKKDPLVPTKAYFILAKMAGKFKTIDKKALKNVISHVEISNRAKEERDMWKQYKAENEETKSNKSLVKKQVKRKHQDSEDSSSSSSGKKRKKKKRKLKNHSHKQTFTMTRVISLEPVKKWGHDGFEELYKNDGEKQQSEDDVKLPKKKKPKKKHKKRKKHRKYSLSD